jgi:hypothetical protein
MAQRVELETAPGSKQLLSSSTNEKGDLSGQPDGVVEAEAKTRGRYLLRRFWRDARGF